MWFERRGACCLSDMGENGERTHREIWVNGKPRGGGGGRWSERANSTVKLGQWSLLRIKAPKAPKWTGIMLNCDLSTLPLIGDSKCVLITKLTISLLHYMSLYVACSSLPSITSGVKRVRRNGGGRSNTYVCLVVNSTARESAAQKLTSLLFWNLIHFMVMGAQSCFERRRTKLSPSWRAWSYFIRAS